MIQLSLIFWLIVGLFPSSINAEDQAVINIGLLQTAEHKALNATREGIQDGLATAGYVDGENLNFHHLDGAGDITGLQSMGENLASNSDLLVALGTPAAQILANETTEIPIYFSAVSDPVGAGLVDTNEQPGGNITGTSDIGPLHHIVDLVQTVGLIYDAGETNSKFQIDLVLEYLKEAELDHVTQTVTSTNDITSAVTSLVQEVDVIMLVSDNTIATGIALVGKIAEEAGVPVVGGSIDIVREYILGTVGFDYYDLGLMTAEMIVQQLEEGTSPAEQPVESIEKTQLYLNEGIAESMGYNVKEVTERYEKLQE